MIKILIIIITILFSPFSFAMCTGKEKIKWELIGINVPPKGDGSSIYLSPCDIEIQGEYRNYYFLQQPRSFEGSLVTRIEMDCKKRKIRFISGKGYYDAMGRGEIIIDKQFDDNAQGFIKQGSMEERIFKKIC
jgi:hypothetical protein